MGGHKNSSTITAITSSVIQVVGRYGRNARRAATKPMIIVSQHHVSMSCGADHCVSSSPKVLCQKLSNIIVQLNATKPLPRITSEPGTMNGINGTRKLGPNQMRSLGVKAIAAATRLVSAVIAKIKKCGSDQKVSKRWVRCQTRSHNFPRAVEPKNKIKVNQKSR